MAAIGGRRSLKSGLTDISSRGADLLAQLRGKRGEAIASNFGDFNNRELSKLIGSTGITKANISAGARLTSAQISANAKVRATAQTQAAKPPKLVTGAKGGLFKVNPNGSLTRTAPDGTMAVRAAAAGKKTYKPVSRAAVESTLAEKVGKFLIDISSQTVTVPAPGLGAPNFDAFADDTKKPKYTKKQAVQLAYNMLAPGMLQFPQNNEASVMRLARAYVDAAFG